MRDREGLVMQRGKDPPVLLRNKLRVFHELHLLDGQPPATLKRHEKCRLKSKIVFSVRMLSFVEV